MSYADFLLKSLCKLDADRAYAESGITNSGPAEKERWILLAEQLNSEIKWRREVLSQEILKGNYPT